MPSRLLMWNFAKESAFLLFHAREVYSLAMFLSEPRSYAKVDWLTGRQKED